MNNIRSTLAIVWRIAAPYFRSEDKWAGRGLLAAVIVDRACAGRDRRPAKPVEQPLLQRASGEELGRLRQRDRLLLRAGDLLHRACGLPALSQSMAADPLAALDDHATISANGCTVPTTTACSCRAMPPTTRTSASPTTSSCSSSDAGYRPRPAELGGDAGVLCHHPVGTVRGSAAASVRQRIRDPRLSGLGRADLCHLRNGADAVDRLAAGQPRFQQQRFEADFRFNLVRVRENSEQIALLQGETAERAAAVGTLRSRGRKLVRHHEPDQAADRVHRELFASRGDLSLHPGGAGLFRRTRSSSAA